MERGAPDELPFAQLQPALAGAEHHQPAIGRALESCGDIPLAG
jgi:hypothetical protein